VPDPNDPSLIIDPRLGSLLVSASGHLNAPPPESRGAPLAFGPPAAAGEMGTLGPYRVVKELGRGAMGAVFLAVDTRLDRRLALKVMLPELAATAEARQRFLREARAAARIGHDNVVTVFEADERDGIPYIAMQLLQGYPLDAFVQNKGTPSLRHVARIGREAALGLTAAHKLGVVHRDVKPANLWLEAPQGRVKLLDFGLARPEGLDTELTTTGVLVGTPAFMSPEQALGERVDHRTDLFSLGAVLYWLSAGLLPFPGPSVAAVLKALGTAEPKPILALNPRVPGPLAELIHRLLAKAPEGRPQTAAEVANRLHEILEQSAGLVPAVLVGGADPAGAPAGEDDPWTTVARSPATQHAGPAPLPGGEPKVLRSMRVVAITPMSRPQESQEPAPQKPAPAAPAPGPTSTVISSGILWEEAEKGTQQERGETEAKRPDRPRRRKAEDEEEEEEETEAKRPDRPRRRRKVEDDEEELDTEERLDRLRRRTAGEKPSSAVPIIIGVGGVGLVAAFVTAAVLVAGGRPKATELAQPKAGDHTTGIPGVRPEPPKEPPPAPVASIPVAPLPVKSGVPEVPSAASVKEPTILGSIAHDPKFKNVGPAGAHLVGLEVRFEKFGDRVIARAVRPIYRVAGREEFGQQHGNDLSGSVTLKARDGYAVGGITGKAELWCHGFSLTYMRVNADGGLDPGDSYESEWAGFEGPCAVVRVIGDGTPVVGIVGKIVGPKTTALGLLFKGQEAWDPAAKSAPVLTRYGAKEVVLGSRTGLGFRDEAPPGGLLVGLDVWCGTFINYDVLDGVRPIYRTGGKETLGEVHGQETPHAYRVLAKPDYAVGGVIMKAGLGADSLVVVFMKVKGDKLDPDDSYQSEKIGGPGGGTHPMLGGDGTPVTGIIGRTDKIPKLNGFGLAFPARR
jgi:serine/threonine protein kinase